MTGFTFTDEYGLWACISYYSHPDPKMPDITLLPMAHLGEADYYTEIKYEAWSHDTAYFEACFIPARRGLHIIHRAFALFSGLTLQSGKQSFLKTWKKEEKTSGKTKLQEEIRTSACDCGECYNLELRLVRADLHRFHAMKAIKTMPWWCKLSLPLIIIAIIIAAPFINLRKHDFDEEDDDDENGLLDKIIKPFEKFIYDDRDLFLATVMAEEITDEKNQNKKLCIKYGAKHMPALANTLLSDFEYELVEQRSVLAIARSKSMDLNSIKTGYGIAAEKLFPKPAFETKEQVQEQSGISFQDPQIVTTDNGTYALLDDTTDSQSKRFSDYNDFDTSLFHSANYDQKLIKVNEVNITFIKSDKEAA